MALNSAVESGGLRGLFQSCDFAALLRTRWMRWLVLLAVVGGVARLLVVAGTVVSRSRQPDFEDYYYGSQARAAGLDPYQRSALDAVAGRQVPGRFLYPPVTLWAFRPLTMLDLRSAKLLFFSLKCLALAALLVIWIKHFNPLPEHAWLLAAVGLLGFGRPAELDLRTGNISTFEQLALWSAFLCYLRGRAWLGCGLVCAVATFKLTPILLLAPWVVAGTRRDRVAAAVCGAAWAFLVFNPWTNPPELVGEFFRTAAAQDERGAMNPSSLAMLRDCADALQRLAGQPLPGLATGLYLPYLIFVAGLAGLVWWRRELQPVEIVLLTVFVYALCVPRFKNYSYVLMVVPALHVLGGGGLRNWARLVLLALVCAHFYRYQQLSTVFALYLIWIAWLWRSRASPAVAGPLPAPVPA